MLCRNVAVGPRARGGVGRKGVQHVVYLPAPEVLVQRPVGSRNDGAGGRGGLDPEGGQCLGIGVQGLAVDRQVGNVARFEELGVVFARGEAVGHGRRAGHLHELPALDAVARVIDRSGGFEGAEEALLLRGVIETDAQREAVVFGFEVVEIAVVALRVDFPVVERPGIVEVRTQCEGVIRRSVPGFMDAQRPGHALVVFEFVARVGLGVEQIGADIDREAAVGNFETLADGEEFTVHIRLETGGQRLPAPFSLDLHQTARQVAVLDRGDTADDLDMLDLVGGDRPHVNTLVYKQFAFEELVGPGNILHVGVVAHGGAVDDERGTEGRSGVIVIRNADLAQMDRIGRRQHRRRGGAARKQCKQVGETRRLDVLHRLAVDHRGAGDPLRFGGRDDDVLDGDGGDTKAHRMVLVARLNGRNRHVPRFVPDERNAGIVHVGRKREDAFTVETRRRGVHLPVRMGFQRDGGVGERGMQRIGDFEHHLAARRRLRAGRARKQKHAENECQAM